jgi:flagellar basal body-associated protein FliL
MAAPDSLAGKKAKCPKCGQIISVPGKAPLAPPPVLAAAAPASSRDDHVDDRSDTDGDFDVGPRGSRKARNAGRDGKPRKKSNTLLFVLLAVGVGALFLCCGVPAGVLGYFYIAHKNQQEAEQKAVAEGKNVMKPTINELVSDYNSNMASADAKYKGKVVELRVRVSSIQGNQVQCMSQILVTLSSSSDPRLATLKPGDEINVRGICNGALLSIYIGNAILLD